MPKNMITKFGEPLYTLKDLARASDVPIKVLREWFANGELKSFMTI